MDMLGRRLRRRGYAVVTAIDGQAGILKAQTEQPDLILMDMSLPVMDGWSATAHLKAEAQTALIPIIALTAHAMVGDRSKAIAAGCDDYDTKPVELKRLLSKIEALLIQHDQAQESPSLPEGQYDSPAAQKTESISGIQLSNPAINPAVNNVLIVDVHHSSSDWLNHDFAQMGLHPIWENSENSVLASLKHNAIELILLVAIVPESLNILHQIRENYSLLELPVIVIFAQNHREKIVQAFEMGANDYAVFPIDFPVLSVRIQALLKTVSLSRKSKPEITSEPTSDNVSPHPQELFRPIKVLIETPISKTFVAQDLRDRDNPLKLVQKIQLPIHEPQVQRTAIEIFTHEIESLHSVKAQDKILLPIDILETEDTFYLISEYIEGSLFSIQSPAIIPGDEWKVIRLTDEILRKVEALHRSDIIHYNLSPSCFMIPKHQPGNLVLIDAGVVNRLLIGLQEIYPIQAFLPSNIAPRCFHQQNGKQTDICAIGMIALQALTGKSDRQSLDILRFKESKWEMLDAMNVELVDFYKKMICKNINGAYTTIPSASRDLLKLWLNLNYSKS